MKRQNSNPNIIESSTAPNAALSNIQLEKFFNKKQIPFHLFSSFEDFNNNHDKYANGMIFTGSGVNKYNKGNSHHWLYYYRPHIYDSYGDPSAYDESKLKEKVVKHPRYQAYGSSVCGEHCANFADYLKGKQSDWINNPNQLLNDYATDNGFTTNQSKNDNIVRNKWNEQMSE